MVVAESSSYGPFLAGRRKLVRVYENAEWSYYKSSGILEEKQLDPAKDLEQWQNITYSS